MSIKRRIIQGIGANGFGQVVTLLIQLASVPIMIHAWGVELYGEWVTLSALPAYLVLSNIGLTSTAGNSLAMLAEKDDQQQHMQEIYQSTWVMVNAVSFSVLALLATIILNFNLKAVFDFKLTSDAELNFTLIVLLLNVAMSMQTGIFEIAFRAIKKNPFAIFFSTTIRLFEWLTATIIVLMGENFLTIAIGMSLIRLFGNLCFWIVLRNSQSRLKIGIGYASFKHIKQLLRPALASMCFPLGLSLSMQGMVLIISSLIGSAGVTLFTIYRTFTRVPIQLATSINQAIWPEISYAYGNNDTLTVKKLVIRMQLICSTLGTVVVCVIYFMGESIIDVWTATPLQHNQLLLNLLTATAFIHIFWQPFWVAQMATNKHIQFAIFFLIIAISTFILGWFLTEQFGLNGAGYTALFTEFLLAIAAFFCYRFLFKSNKQNSCIIYLIKHRYKPTSFTYPWYKTWAKRAVNFRGLCKILWRNYWLSRKGVTMGHLSVIGNAELNGNAVNLVVGNECFIGSNVHLALHDKIILGNNVVINDGCTLLTGSHDVNCPKWKQVMSPIVIHDYVWIATNSIILPGVTIGKGAVVGAGSVVTKNIPAYQIFAGNPAKFIKERKLKQLTHVPVRRLAPFEAWLGLPEFEDNSIEN